MSRLSGHFSQEEGRSPTPRPPSFVRLSGIFRTVPAPGAGAGIPLRRVVLWSVIGAAIVVGLVFYFRYGRQITPLVS